MLLHGITLENLGDISLTKTISLQQFMKDLEISHLEGVRKCEGWPKVSDLISPYQGGSVA
jgi:hypothetical protein